MKFQEISERCWTGYRQAGMKKKGDKMVPNCVPVEEGEMSADRNTAKSLAQDLKSWIEDYQEIQAAGLDSSNIGYIRKLKRNIETAHEQIRRLGYRFDANNPDLVRLMGRSLAEIKTGPEMTLNDLLFTAAAKAMHQAGLEGVPMDYEEAIKKAARIYRIPYTPSELPRLLAQRAEIDRKLAMMKQGKQIAKARRKEKLAPTPAGAEEYWKTHALPTDRIKPPAKTLEETEAELEEDLRKWFKEKWVRFGPDGKIRGDCARGSSKEGKPKCLPAAKAHALGKKGRASAAAKKRREDPNPERRGPARNVATKVREQHDWDDADEFGMPGSEFFSDDDRLRDGDYVRDSQDGEYGEIFRMSGDPSERRVRILDRDGKGWYISPERLVAVDRNDPDIMKYFGKRRHRDMDESALAEGFEYGNQVQHPKYGAGQVIKVYSNGTITVNFPNYPDPIDKKPGVQSNFGPGDKDYQSLKPVVSEKQDACYRKVKSRYKVWPSAYASGALVQCRKKGAANWGTGGKKK